MSRTLDPPHTETTAANRLRATMAAVRLSITWLGVRKSLTSEQKNQAADSFGAEGKFLSAGKKLLDTAHPAFKAVTAVRGRAVSYWKGVSLPFPEPGIRLIRQDNIADFNQHSQAFQQELDEAVVELNEHYADLRSAARERLGDLYNPGDYPHSLLGLFAIEHDFPSIEPPNYLRQLNPELYEQECQRMQARFDEAVQLAEQAFYEELSKLVEHLSERLNGDVDGKPKVFRDTAITNLTDFFERFQQLNIRSNEQLDDLVGQCQRLVSGIEPQSLRGNLVLRQSVATELGEVRHSLEELLVDRPRRNILRKPR